MLYSQNMYCDNTLALIHNNVAKILHTNVRYVWKCWKEKNDALFLLYFFFFFWLYVAYYRELSLKILMKRTIAIHFYLIIYFFASKT